MERQVPIGVWLEFVEDAYEENLFNDPDQALYEDLFPYTATVMPPPTPHRQDEDFWHTYWVFLNLVESLIAALKPVSVTQPEVTRDASGYRLDHSPVQREAAMRSFTPATSHLDADTVNQLLPTLSIHGGTATAHVWCDYTLPGKEMADFAIVFDQDPVTFEPGVVAKLSPQHLRNITCAANGSTLWRLQAENNTFTFKNRGMPPFIVDGKLGEAAMEAQSPLQAHVSHAFQRIIVSDRWKHAPDLPERYTEIRNDGDMLNGQQLQNKLQTAFQKQFS